MLMGFGEMMMSEVDEFIERLRTAEGKENEAVMLLREAREEKQELSKIATMLKADLSGYILFGGDNYYPSGGWADMRRIYKDINDFRMEDVQQGDEVDCSGSWWHLVNIKTGVIVREGELEGKTSW